MKHSEAAYINAGFAYERARNPTRMTAIGDKILTMLATEPADDRNHARHLIEQGRKEARQ